MLGRLRKVEKAIIDRLNNSSEHNNPDEFEVKMLERLAVVHTLMIALVFVPLALTYALLGIIKFAKNIFG